MKILTPITIGRMALKNRIAAPPHAAMLGSIVGTDDEAERYIAHWRSLAEGGTGWLIALNGFVENFVPPGFDPSGVGSRKAGVFRHPLFVERMGRLAADAHAHGARISTQLIMQGGMPHGPSHSLSGPVINNLPHALTRKEIRVFVAEYRHSAEQALRAGLDGIELHANHDDLIEWFLSPLTNRRTDEYGGSLEHRMKFLAEILSEIRAGVGDRLTIGVRLNMAETEPGGYDEPQGLAIAGLVETGGLADYLHLVMGTGWGYPSYIQTAHFRPGQWAEMAGRFRAQLRLPIVYAGRVNRPEVAEQIVAAGHADVVAVGRAHLADPDFVRKASGGPVPLRLCIGTNDCINRGVAEGLPFACAVNPSLGTDDRGATRDHGPATPPAGDWRRTRWDAVGDYRRAARAFGGIVGTVGSAGRADAAGDEAAGPAGFLGVHRLAAATNASAGSRSEIPHERDRGQGRRGGCRSRRVCHRCRASPSNRNRGRRFVGRLHDGGDA